ncbi:hypothetical protein AK830_g1643 [Neonectria ditissima]|uniref:NB-ARC domain-containing protein n=1 Tax=Neonectria ditissima TaxID=78410 RepID=A0A0P7BDX5_9HYPO|nr:hypothetical protein AK830_g1643 [Neonectria ditissima]
MAQKMISQLYPCLNAMRWLFPIFTSTIPSVSIEAAVFWGILHLAIESAVRSSESLQKMVEVLNEIRRELAFFKQCSEHVTDDLELQNSIVDSLVTLMEFWLKANEAFGHTSSARLRNGATAWFKLDSALEETMTNLHKAMENVRRHALLGATLGTAGPNQAHSMTKALSRLKMNEEDNSLFPCYSLPAKLPYFYGRKAEEARIVDYLEPELEPDELRICVIYGLGGTGKSATAQAYTDRCRTNGTYDAIFWVNSQKDAEIHESFVQIARKLELPKNEGAQNSDTITVKIKNWLATTKKKWLLVYDNVEDPELLQKALPSGNGRLLLTTRSKWLTLRFKGSRALELSTFSDDESVELFQGSCRIYDSEKDRSAEKSEWKSLLAELGGLALAIDLMAAYVSYRNFSVAKARKQFERTFQRIITKSEASSTEKGLATIWEVQFTEIHGTFAAEVLAYLSLMSPDAIPTSLFIPEEEWDEEISEILGHSEDE